MRFQQLQAMQSPPRLGSSRRVPGCRSGLKRAPSLLPSGGCAANPIFAGDRRTCQISMCVSVHYCPFASSLLMPFYVLFAAYAVAWPNSLDLTIIGLSFPMYPRRCKPSYSAAFRARMKCNYLDFSPSSLQPLQSLCSIPSPSPGPWGPQPSSHVWPKGSPPHRSLG